MPLTSRKIRLVNLVYILHLLIPRHIVARAAVGLGRRMVVDGAVGNAF